MLKHDKDLVEKLIVLERLEMTLLAAGYPCTLSYNKKLGLVKVIFPDGRERVVNVAFDSHLAMVFDILMHGFLDLLDEIRERVGGPVELSCAYRCPNHNADVGGVTNSQHVLGTAADVLVPDGWSVDKLADLAVELGADGVGRYYSNDFVHVDVRDGRVGSGYAWNG